MTDRLVGSLSRFRMVALSLISVAISPAFAAAEARLGFCPLDYKLWSAICISNQTGDVVRPATRGPAYARVKASLDAAQLCGAWDMHVTTQIEDFGLTRRVSADRLASAGQLQAIARWLWREGRHAEAIVVYESIFADVD